MATLCSCTTVYSEKVEVPMKWKMSLPSHVKRGLESLFITPLPA